MNSTLVRYFRLPATLFAVGCLSVFAQTPKSSAPKSSSVPASQRDASRGSGATRVDYILQPRDIIRVQVFEEEEFNKLGEVQVSQEYTIVLPLLGSVDLRGKTIRQAETHIREQLEKDYFVKPHVLVGVVKYVERVVKIFGSVNDPGVVLFPPEGGLTLSDAISRVGGFSRLADQKKVILTRTGSDGRANSQQINAADLLKGGGEDVALQPDDIIDVKERVL